MSPEIIELWNIIKEVIKDVALYIMPIAAVIISLIALRKSKDSVEVRVQLSDLEQKLKEYELALKEHELEKIRQQENEEPKVCIEARIINISKNKYKAKIWNSGNATAYNISVSIPQEYQIVLMKNKMPFEYLEPGNSFEEHVIIHMQSSHKFKIISQWENEHGEIFTNEQLRSV